MGVTRERMGPMRGWLTDCGLREAEGALLVSSSPQLQNSSATGRGDGKPAPFVNKQSVSSEGVGDGGG